MKLYRETRVNLTGVVKFKTLKDEKTKAVTYIPETAVDEKTNETVLATGDEINLVEGSKGYQEIFEAHKVMGWPTPSVTKHQSFLYSEVEDPSEVVGYFSNSTYTDSGPLALGTINPLGLDPVVAAKQGAAIFQRGWAIAQQVEIRAFMTDSNQVEIDGDTSVAVDAAQPGERKQKDPMAAAAASLKKAGFDINVDDLKSLMQQMSAASQQPQPAGTLAS